MKGGDNTSLRFFMIILQGAAGLTRRKEAIFMAFFEKFDLQLFAEGGDGGSSGSGAAAPGGEGASEGQAKTGDNNAVDAEQQRINRLLAAGVPKEKIRTSKRTVEFVQDVAAPQNQPKEEPEAKPEETSNPKEKRLSWDEIMQDPEYNAEMQKTVKKRYKKEHEFREKLAPALELLGQHYGITADDMESFDIDAFTKAVTEDHQFYEDKAMELGMPVEQVMKLDKLERDEARRKKAEEKTVQQQMIEEHLQGLVQQGESLKQKFPGFDIRAELQNPTFARLTAPGSGLSVEDAYFAVHRRELMQAQKQQQVAAMQYTAQQTAQALSNSIQSGMRRPDESSPSQAASYSSYDYSVKNKNDREKLKAAIMAAKARGEKVYPPGIK